jgi:hypothetical protein
MCWDSEWDQSRKGKFSNQHGLLVPLIRDVCRHCLQLFDFHWEEILLFIESFRDAVNIRETSLDISSSREVWSDRKLLPNTTKGVKLILQAVGKIILAALRVTTCKIEQTFLVISVSLILRFTDISGRTERFVQSLVEVMAQSLNTPALFTFLLTIRFGEISWCSVCFRVVVDLRRSQIWSVLIFYCFTDVGEEKRCFRSKSGSQGRHHSKSDTR